MNRNPVFANSIRRLTRENWRDCSGERRKRSHPAQRFSESRKRSDTAERCTGRAKWNESSGPAISETHTRDLAQELGVSTLALHQRAEKLGIKKTAEHIRLVLEECGKQISHNEKAIASRFKKGIVPANKGMRRPGWYAGRMRETQFKKGQSPGNTMPLWTFRWVNAGVGNGRGAGTRYLMLKTGKPAPPPYSGWEFVHKLIWEQANGPLPDWRVARLWWKDGDHANCSLSNLELVTAEEHMRRTTVHNLPAPLPQLIQLAGALKRKIRRKEKQQNGEEHVAGSQGSPVCDARSALG